METTKSIFIYCLISYLFPDILQFTCTIKAKDPTALALDFSNGDAWRLDTSILVSECLAKSFTWAQWDSDNQALYYIHMKPKAKSISLMETDDDGDNGENIMSPTLSAFQFNDKLPTETVVCTHILKLSSILSFFFWFL